MKHNECSHCFRGCLLFWNIRHHVTVLGGNDTEKLWQQTLLGHFRMTTTTFQMLCNETGPLVRQVMPPHYTKSHYFFDVHGGIYSANEFPSPILFTWTFFFATCRKTFLWINILLRYIFFEMLGFHSFLMQYFKIRIKTGWLKHCAFTSGQKAVYLCFDVEWTWTSPQCCTYNVESLDFQSWGHVKEKIWCIQ